MDFYERFAPALLRKAERMLQSRHDAQDVVHGLFLDLLTRGETTSDLPYLYRAVTNRCLNLLRDQKNRERLLSVHEPALRGPARLRCGDTVVDLELLAKLVERLDATSLEILVYHFVDDMAQEEIATLTGLSRKTVGKRLQQVRDHAARMKSELSEVLS
jgi:RNA polymerase sigma factor (sigma-70 family)